MKSKYNNIEKSKIYEIIKNGLIEENRFYHCEIPVDLSVDDDSIVEALSNAYWVNGVDEPLSKNEQRGVSILTQLQTSVDSNQAVVVGICNCYVNRETKNEVEIDTCFEEIELNPDNIKLQMSDKDYRKFFLSSLKGDNDEKVMSPVIVKCKNLPKVPKCDKCKGSGRVECGYCHGYGNGRCPDCKGDGRLFPDGKFGEEHWFYNKIGYYQHNQRVLSMDDCPSCKGTGEFKCDVCDGSGETECKDCKGSGLRKNGKKAQKVTRLIEKYNINKRCFLSMPNNDVIDIEPNFASDILAETPSCMVNKAKREEILEILEASNVNNTYANTVLKEISESPNLFALNVAFEKLDKVFTVRYDFKGDEYRILIVDNQAFTEAIPEISFLEKLFGKYK